VDEAGGRDEQQAIVNVRLANARLRRLTTNVLLGGLALLAAFAAFGLVSLWPALALAVPLVVALWQLGRFGFDERRSAEVVVRGPDFPERLQKLMDVLPDPTIVIDRRGLIVSFNREALSVFPTLQRDHPLSFAVRAPDVLGVVEEVLAGRSGRQRVELLQQVPVERAFEVLISPIARSAARELITVVLHDLTQARRIEAMRVDFVANASHELRTPLASLLGFIETLQGPARNDAAARERFLGIMAQQARRMSRLIDDLLSLSRIEMNAHVQPRAPVDLVPVVGHIVDTLAGMAHDRDVEIVVERDAQELIVAGERDELLRVFENLIENAIKYGQSGGRVEVRLTTGQGIAGRAEATVTVADHGPGIAAEHLPRLTERFYRVDVADSREKGGTGLGLAIVKHIVNRHRGRLDIESRLGEGTRVSVTFALWSPDLAATE